MCFHIRFWINLTEPIASLLGFFLCFFLLFFNNHLGFHLIIEIFFLMLNNNDGNVQSYFKKKFIFHMFK